MIQKNRFINIITIILFCALIPSCAKNHERALEKAAMAYRNGDMDAAEEIEQELIQGAALFSSNDDNLHSGDAMFYTRQKNKITILYPDKNVIRVPEQGEDEHVASSRNHAAWSDGKSLVLHDLHTGKKKLIATADQENPIRGVALYNDMVLYYMNYRLYCYDITQKHGTLLINDTFKPEYKKYYSVSFQRHRNMMVICVGIAGSYRISVIGPAMSIVVKNIKATSSRFHLDGGSLYYITGLSGAWRLTRFSLNDRKKVYLRSFSTVTDLVLTPAGCFFENKSGLHAAAYSGNELRLPFQYTIAGKSGDMALLKFRERLFAIDSKKFSQAAQRLKENVPALFAP